MKLLLDECITKKLKPYLDGFDVYTVVEMGWCGVKNGKLLSLCVLNNFDVFLTIDKNMIYQQNLEKHQITIVVFDSLTSKLEELKLFVPTFSKQICNMEKNKVYIIEKSELV